MQQQRQRKGGQRALDQRARHRNAPHRYQLAQVEAQPDPEKQKDHADLGEVLRNRPVGDESLVNEALRQSGAPVVLVVNKCDLAGPEQLLPLLGAYGQLREFAAIVPVSALTGAGTERLLEVILAQLPEGPRYYPDDQVTDLPERFIAAELIRERLLVHTRDEVPYGTAVQIESFNEEPERDLVVIQAVILVEREMHKRMVVGKGGAMIRRIGQEARHEIEGLLGVRVFLELFVRVQSGWTGSDRALREIGYLGE